MASIVASPGALAPLAAPGKTSLGMCVAIIREDGKVEIWNWEKRFCERTLRLEGIAPRKESLRVSACSSDARLIIGCIQDFDKVAKLWCLQTGNVKGVLQGHDMAVTAVAISPDAASAATGSEDSTVRLWSAWGGHCKLTMQGHKKLVTSVAFAPDGSFLASGSLDCTVKIWCLETGICTVSVDAPLDPRRPLDVQPWEIQPEGILAIDISQDGKMVASCQDNGVVAVWDPKTGECKTFWEAHQSGIGHLAFAPSGSLLATSSCRDGVGCAKLWNLANASLQQEFKLVALRTLSFISAEQLVTIQSFPDWSARLWNVDTGRELGERRLHDSAVVKVAAWL